MRILVLTDSLGLPRQVPSEVRSEETWVSLLKANINQAEFIQFSAGGFSTNDLLTQVSYYSCYSPDVVIIQMGVVDCAPRAIKQDEFFLKRVFQIITILNASLGKSFFEFVRRKRAVSYVDASRFEKNVRIILKEFKCPSFWISIASSSTYEKILPGVSLKVSTYNHILKNILGSNYIDCTNLSDTSFMVDGHHPNVKGHNEIYHLVKSRIENGL